MLLGDAAHHNVYGYNYSYDQHTDDGILGIDWVTGDMCLHGHNDTGVSGPYENLYEGNIGSFVRIDDAHGSNGDYNTFFRNEAGEVGLEICSGNDNQNIVNNYFRCGHYGLSMYGFSWIVEGSGHLKKNNKCKDRDFWNNWNTHWENHDSSYNDDISYYFEEQPDFMEGYPWPLYPEGDDNPAKDRKDSGGIRPIFTGYKNYGIYCRGNVSLADSLGDVTAISINLDKQDSAEDIEDIHPDSNGVFLILLAEEQFGIYNIEYSLDGYYSVTLEDIEIMEYQEVPEIPDVTLLQMNNPPYVILPIPDQYKLVDFEEFFIDLNNHFDDEEGDELFYGMNNDSLEILCVIMDTLLIINSVQNWMGTTIINVTADDGISPLSAIDTFEINVVPDSINSPTNVSIYYESDSVYIVWNKVEDAVSYRIFSSSFPSDSLWIPVSEDVRDTTWSSPITEDRKFFYIRAVK